ncbi:MAG: DUF433 domain-containing protein [Blastocatellia bacterium]
MMLKVEDYVFRRRDSVWERELARQLRELPEAERFEFINEFLNHTLLGLMFANKCLREPKYFKQLLYRGLETADASSIKEWLECVVPRLGFNRVIAILREEVERDPQAVDKAVYWMHGFVPDGDPEARQALRELVALVASKGGLGALINYQQQGIPVQDEPLPLTESDVETRNGLPVFGGTEVPIQALFDAIAKGQTLHQFLARFPAVSRQQALAVISNAQEMFVKNHEKAA